MPGGQDLTLRYDAATQTAQLIDTATSSVIASSRINATADNLVRVIGTASNNILRIDPSVPAAQLAVDFDALGGSDRVDLSRYPGSVTTALEGRDKNFSRRTLTPSGVDVAK